MQGVTINSKAGQLILRHSDFTIEGGKSRFNFASGDPAQSLDRAIRIGGGGFSAESTASPIIAGAISFDGGTAAAGLKPGDWVCVVSVDPTNWVQVEYKQVDEVGGTIVHVTSPFVQDFPAIRPVHWVTLLSPISNVRISGLIINTSNTVNGNIGIDAQPSVIDLTVEDCQFDIANGLAWQFYGLVNPRALNNVVRQVGRHSAVSSCHGGVMRGNVFRAGRGLPTNSGLTVETGTFGTLFEGNDLAGSGGAGVIYHSDANFCRYRNNLIMGDGAAIGILVQGGSDNSFQGDTIVNVSEGITFMSDTSLSAVNGSERNSVANEIIRNAPTGVKFNDANCRNNAVTGLDVDTATIKEPVMDFGTNTIIR